MICVNSNTTIYGRVSNFQYILFLGYYSSTCEPCRGIQTDGGGIANFHGVPGILVDDFAIWIDDGLLREFVTLWFFEA